MLKLTVETGKILIDKRTVSDLKRWFKTYANTFKCNDIEVERNTVIKVKHTKQVCTEIINIGEKLGLNEDQLRLSEIIALFHDIGRFEQYVRYRTFNDKISENHAELGIKILKRNRVLDQLDYEIRDLIFCSINNHNKPALPPGETETCIFYSGLIRDADKLDILRVITGYYHRKERKRNGALELDLPDTPGFSENVGMDLINKKAVDIKHVRNLNDLKLLQAGWIYDINFKPTLDCIKKYNYMEKIREALPDSEEINGIFKIIHSPLNQKKFFF